MSITAALYTRLADDDVLAGMLATYGPDNAPAIFTGATVPGDARFPWLHAPGAETDTPYEAKNEAGRSFTRRIRCVTDEAHTAVLVEAIADRVHALLHRHPLTIAGVNNYVVDVDGPTVVATDPDLQGRDVVARFLTTEE